jgi:hypothetical protein
MSRAWVTLRSVQHTIVLMLQCAMFCNDVLGVACGVDWSGVMTMDIFGMAITIPVMSLSIRLVSLRPTTRYLVMSYR